MAMIELDLDTIKPQEQIEVISGRQGETNLTIRANIFENGTEYDFSGKYLEFNCLRPDGELVHVVDGCKHVGNTNTWEITLPEEATSVDGLTKICYCSIRDTSNRSFRETTNTFLIDFDASATKIAHIGPYSDQVDALVLKADTLIKALEKIESSNSGTLEALVKKYETALNDLARNRLSSYVDKYIKTGLEANLTDEIQTITESIVGNVFQTSIAPMFNSLQAANIKGVLTPSQGGTGATSRRGVKEWLGLQVKSFLVTFSGDNFTVSGEQVNSGTKKSTIYEEDDLTFKVEPTEGHLITGVTADDEAVNITLSGEYYTARGITKDTTITIATEEEPEEFTITFSGDNCTITGRDIDITGKSAKVIEGNDLDFHVEASEQYKIDSVTADNEATVTDKTEGNYTLTNITQSTTVTIATSATEAA